MTEDSVTNIFSTTFNVTDHLKKQLQDKVIILAQQNAMLQKNINLLEVKYTQMETEANDLRRKLEAMEHPTLPAPFTASSQNINVKIVELSKNYREKCAELEKYKTKCSKLMAHIDSIKRTEEIPVTPALNNPPENKGSQETLLQEKLNSVTNKMLELKNANLLLKNELRQANKLLQQETGTDLIELKNGGSWKGRAQVICDLQEKNKKLKEKLRHMIDHGGGKDAETNTERLSSKTLLLEKMNADLKSQNDSIKAKSELLKSRCQMLEVECHTLKANLRDIKEKRATDLEVITNLTKQLSEAETVKKCALKERELTIKKMNTDIQNLEAQVNIYKTVLENMKSENIRVKQESEQPQGVNLEDLQKNLENVEQEKCELLELLNTYKSKLEMERNEHDKCRQIYLLERQKTVKLEGAVATFELGSLTTNRSRYSHTSQTSGVIDKNIEYQLEVANETIKTLKARLEMEKNERKRDFEDFYKIISVRNKKDN